MQTNNNTFNDIIDKLKNRLPMFIVNIYCVVITMAYGDQSTDLITSADKSANLKYFKIYYIFLCICAIVWDLWHSGRTIRQLHTADQPLVWSVFSGVCFVTISIAIAFPFFVMVTNLVSMGLPFRLFFGFNRDQIFMTYGAILPFIYFMNIVENIYWKKYVDRYVEIKDLDDLEEDHNVTQILKNNDRTVV